MKYIGPRKFIANYFSVPSCSTMNAIYHGFIAVIFTLPGEYLAKCIRIFEYRDMM